MNDAMHFISKTHPETSTYLLVLGLNVLNLLTAETETVIAEGARAHESLQHRVHLHTTAWYRKDGIVYSYAHNALFTYYAMK